VAANDLDEQREQQLKSNRELEKNIEREKQRRAAGAYTRPLLSRT
jgi:hypothetical protein